MYTHTHTHKYRALTEVPGGDRLRKALKFSKVRSMETFFFPKQNLQGKKGGTDILKSTLCGDFFPQKNLQNNKGGQRH